MFTWTNDHEHLAVILDSPELGRGGSPFEPEADGEARRPPALCQEATVRSGCCIRDGAPRMSVFCVRGEVFHVGSPGAPIGKPASAIWHARVSKTASWDPLRCPVPPGPVRRESALIPQDRR